MSSQGSPTKEGKSESNRGENIATSRIVNELVADRKCSAPNVINTQTVFQKRQGQPGEGSEWVGLVGHGARQRLGSREAKEEVK